MTSTTGRRVHSQKFGKHRVGVLGAAVVAASVVTFGSAGIAHAYTVVNNTGGDVTVRPGQEGYGIATFQLPNGGTWNTEGDGQSRADFWIPNSNNTWFLTWDQDLVPGFQSGTASGSASFNPNPDVGWGVPMPTTEYLTLGGTTKSFFNDPVTTTGGGGWNPNNSVSFVRTNFAWGPPIRTRGAVIVVNEKPMKIWNPRTNPLRGVAAKPTAPVSAVATVSLASSTLPAQPQSVAKTATPHRAASRR